MRSSGGVGAEDLFPRGETVSRQAGSSPRTPRAPKITRCFNSYLVRTKKYRLAM